jgi:hypothetical protein
MRLLVINLCACCRHVVDTIRQSFRIRDLGREKFPYADIIRKSCKFFRTSGSEFVPFVNEKH